MKNNDVVFELFTTYDNGEIDNENPHQIEAFITTLPRIGEDIYFSAHYDLTEGISGKYTVVEIAHCYDMIDEVKRKPADQQHASHRRTFIKAVVRDAASIPKIEKLGNKYRISQ